MAAELPRPGVEVIQVFQTVTPTVITPTLVPCIVGVCRQVVDVLVTTATGARTLNPQALVAVNAILLSIAGSGSPPVYAGLDSLNLDLSLNNGPLLSIVFSGTPLSPANIVAQILLALGAAGITSFTAEAVGTTQWRLRSIAANNLQSIEVLSSTAPAVLAAFGFGPGLVETGLTGYDQHNLDVAVASFPDPNHNLAQLVIDPTSVEAFLFLGSTGSTLLQLSTSSCFLENGIGTAATHTGTADLTGLSFATAAVVTGSTDITSGALYGVGGTLAGGGTGLTLILTVNGVGPTTLTFDGTGAGNDASEAAMLAAIHTTWPALAATDVATNLRLTDSVLGAGSHIVIGAGTANTALGLSPGTHNGTAGTLDGETLILTINGGASPLTVTFAPAVDLPTTLAQINAVIGALATATEAPSTHFLVLTTVLLGADTSIVVGAGTANTNLGLVTATYTGSAGVTAIDSGSGQAVTPLLQFLGADFTAAATAGQITGTSPITAVVDGHTLILDDGNEPQTLGFLGAATALEILAQINALFGAAGGGLILATKTGGNDLVLTNTTLGVTSIVKVVGGTALAELGLTAAAVSRGNPFPPLPGDEIWVDGVDYATIVQVAPGGNVNQLRINQQVPISNDVGLAWYIIANNLSATAPAAGVTRPFPNLVVDPGTGNIAIKPEILRNTQGNPVYPASAQLYVAYHALRLDVTPKASSPGLLKFSDTTTLGTQLAPVDTDNPLALGFYFALLNAPGTLVVGIGVDAYTEGSPDGTVEAFTRAATFLEGFEVYGIAPLTHDPSVFQIFHTHVDTMSLPENKGERIVVINPSVPANKLDSLVASGINGNTTLTANQFDTGVHNLDALLLGADSALPPTGPYTTADGIFLDIGDGNHYNIINVVGTLVSIKTSGFLPGENDDGYYATTPLPSPLIAEPFAVRIRGAKLVLTDGVTPDLDGIALTVQQTAQGYSDRRVWSTFPDSCAATLQGIEQVIDGFYMNAAIVGMIARQPPQQSFTNFPMTGFTRVIGSSDRFSEPQQNVMAAGGNYIIVQDATGAPLTSRMALTTDLTSIETRTDSITKVVDFTAKFMRQGLKAFIGRFNITQGFLDSLGHVIQGLLGFLTDSGVLIGANLNNIVQDTSAPDTVLVDVTLDVPFPCNYIRLTLTI